MGIDSSLLKTYCESYYQLGTLEALEVIKTALGLPNLENKVLMVNLLDLRFNIIDIVKNEKCI